MTDSTDTPAAAQAIVVHAERLCKDYDHLRDVLAELSIPVSQLEDRRQQGAVTFRTTPLVRAFLYAEIRGLSQTELVDELETFPSTLASKFGLPKVPTQQSVSHAWNCFSPATRRTIEAAAEGIATAAVDSGVVRESLTPHVGDDADSDPDDEDERGREEAREKAKKSIRLARKHATSEFDTGRADNKEYSDEAILEMFFRIAADNGSANEEGEIAWLLDDDLTCHGSTFLRAMKLFADPDGDDAQTAVDDFGDDRMPRVEAIRDELMEAFDAVTDNVLRTIRGDLPDDDRHVVAAIDVTHVKFWPSPWLDKEAGIPKRDYPRMVSGYANDNDNDRKYRRVYKFATVTIVGANAPIILGIEPVKEDSKWEPEDSPSYSKGNIVGRLLDRAQRVADIDEVLMDRAFYAVGAMEAVENRDLLYTIPVPKYEPDLNNIERIEKHPAADAAVLHDAVVNEGQINHAPEFLYTPSTDDDHEGQYAIFATNRDHVPPEEIQQHVNRYSRRWDIENQYKTVKKFMPRTSSTDYRVRLGGFTLAAILYNLWRLVDFLIKVGLGELVRSEPRIEACVVAEAMGEFLRRVT